jgi:hypothetical protein
MANPHHRKKHKHFQPPPRPANAKTKSGAASVFAIVGAVAGAAIPYFIVPDNIYIIIGGLVTGILIGYFIGNNIDKSGK